MKPSRTGHLRGRGIDVREEAGRSVVVLQPLELALDLIDRLVREAFEVLARVTLGAAPGRTVAQVAARIGPTEKQTLALLRSLQRAGLAVEGSRARG